jgi:hypothetical protein
MVTHRGFDNSDINKDVNAMFPPDRLRELRDEGFIGSLAGMSTIIIAALPPIARQQGAPQISAPHVPIGSNAGEPNNKVMQTAILRDTLNPI